MNKRMKVGIFFGGKSREREISFAGGRTVYDNLDKRLFEPIPIFVDACNNLIQLHWRYLYKGTIRDFYIADLSPLTTPTAAADVASLPHTDIGPRLTLEALKETIDVAFLALHGPYGEDGSIQGMLDWLQIPYSGSGILGAAIGLDKVVQKQLMQAAGYCITPYQVIARKQWEDASLDKEKLLDSLIDTIGLPLVIKSPRQGSSIGVHILTQRDVTAFATAVDHSFFRATLTAKDWKNFTEKEQALWLTQLADCKTGIGLPLIVNSQRLHTSEQLLTYINAYFAEHDDTLSFDSLAGEACVLVEAFVAGREFSCIVLQEIGEEPIVLPPTEIVKGELHFDYHAKYLPGLVRKETPMQLPAAQLAALQATCVSLFKDLHFQVYARIDGILCTDGQIYLNDPNTTAGMNPSSFLFHQAAEVGMNTSQLLTFVIRNSLAKHVATYHAPPQVRELLQMVDDYLAQPS